MGTSMLEEAVREYFGERCPDFDEGCEICLAWRELDQAKANASIARLSIEQLFGNKVATDIFK